MHTSFTLRRDANYDHAEVGTFSIGLGTDETLTLTLDRYDELPVAANLAAELLAAAMAVAVSDEPSTRASARVRLMDVIAKATILVGMIDDADVCTCTLAHDDKGRTVLTTTGCPQHAETAP